MGVDETVVNKGGLKGTKIRRKFDFGYQPFPIFRRFQAPYLTWPSTNIMKRECSGSRRNSSKQRGAQRYQNLTKISSLYQPFPLFRQFQAPYPRSYERSSPQLRFPKVSRLTSPRSPTFASPEVSPQHRKIIKL